MRTLRSAPSKPITTTTLSRARLTAGVSESVGSSMCDDGLMTVGEAADFLRVSRSSVYGLMEQGKLAFAKFGKSRRIPKKALLELAEKSLVG